MHVSHIRGAKRIDKTSSLLIIVAKDMILTQKKDNEISPFFASLLRYYRLCSSFIHLLHTFFPLILSLIHISCGYASFSMKRIFSLKVPVCSSPYRDHCGYHYQDSYQARYEARSQVTRGNQRTNLIYQERYRISCAELESYSSPQPPGALHLRVHSSQSCEARRCEHCLLYTSRCV